MPLPLPLGARMSRQGWSAGAGWTSQTSPAYPAMWPLLRASTIAMRSQMAPRAVLTIQAPFFILEMASALMRPRVPSCSGQLTVRTSTEERSSSRVLTRRALILEAASAWVSAKGTSVHELRSSFRSGEPAPRSSVNQHRGVTHLQGGQCSRTRGAPCSQRPRDAGGHGSRYDRSRWCRRPCPRGRRRRGRSGQRSTGG